MVVAVINAMNFVDGLDGLAAGLGTIAAMAILVLSVNLLTQQEGAVSTYPPALIAGCAGGSMYLVFFPTTSSRPVFLWAIRGPC